MNQEKSEKLMILVFLLFWGYLSVNFLSRSLWIDEAISYWLSIGSFKETFVKVYNLHSFSPLFFLFENLALKINDSEIASRLPSLFFGLASLFGMFLLAKLIFDKHTALLSTLILFSSSNFLASAVNARPYALSILSVILSMYFLLLWIKSNKSIWLILHTIFSISMILSHYLFSLMLPIFLFTFFILRKKNNSKLKFLIALSINIAPLALGFLQIKNLNQSANMSFQTVSFFEVLSSIINPALFVLALSCLLISLPKIRGDLAKFKIDKSAKLIICITWFLFPPILLWLLGFVANSPLYQSRYVVYCMPAYALLCAYLIQNCFQEKIKLIAIFLFQIFCIYIQFYNPKFPNENWRTAVRLIKERSDYNKQTPIIVHSTLMESGSNDWLVNKEKAGYLLAPFSIYKISNKKIPFPLFLNLEKHKEYFKKILEPTIKSAENLYLITRAGSEGINYLSKIFSKFKYSTKVIMNTKSVSVLSASRETS